MSRVVFSYSQTILVPIPGQTLRLAIQAINVTKGRDPSYQISQDEINRMSTASARSVMVDVYDDGTRVIRGSHST